MSCELFKDGKSALFEPYQMSHKIAAEGWSAHDPSLDNARGSGSLDETVDTTPEDLVEDIKKPE